MEFKTRRYRPRSQVRCENCNALLGTIEGDILTLRRGGLVAVIDGDYHASIQCYRPRCRVLNVLVVKPEGGRGNESK